MASGLISATTGWFRRLGLGHGDAAVGKASGPKKDASAVGKTNSRLQFWDSGLCPFAHRVWLALDEKNIPYETHKVDLEHRPEEFKRLYRSASQDEGARGKVPILVDGSVVLIESIPIVEYLDMRYPESGTKLLPGDPLDCYKVKLFADTYSNRANFIPLLEAANEAEAAEAKEKLVDGLKVLDRFIRHWGSEAKPGYFLGHTYSFAETVTSSFLRRMVVALPPLRGIDIDEIVDEEGLTRLRQWIQASLERSSMKHTGPSDKEIVESLKGFTAEMEEE